MGFYRARNHLDGDIPNYLEGMKQIEADVRSLNDRARGLTESAGSMAREAAMNTGFMSKLGSQETDWANPTAVFVNEFAVRRVQGEYLNIFKELLEGKSIDELTAPRRAEQKASEDFQFQRTMSGYARQFASQPGSLRLDEADKDGFMSAIKEVILNARNLDELQSMASRENEVMTRLSSLQAQLAEVIDRIEVDDYDATQYACCPKGSSA